MKVVEGSVLRLAVNLSVRLGPSVSSERIAAAYSGVLVTALAEPERGWMRGRVAGWQNPDYPGKVYSEPHEKSSAQATRSVDDAVWERVVIEGYLSLSNPAWFVVEDGPKD